MPDISNESILARNEAILFSKLDDELVMMSSINGEYYGLDDIGTRIWEILEKPTTFEALIVKIMDEYDVTKNKCIEDVTDLLLHLSEKNIIIIK